MASDRTLPVLAGVLLLACWQSGLHAAGHITESRHAPGQWVTPAVRGPRIRHRTFESKVVGSKVSYHIYTPESYGRDGERRFPVLYWLHGAGGGLAGVRTLTQHFDAAIRGGRMPPVLVVFPNGHSLSLWVDSKDGRVPMETVLVDELVPHVDASFRTVASREGRLIEGFSMGGYGAARLGLKHHKLFGAVSIFAGGPLQRDFTHSPRAGRQQRLRVLRTVFGGDHAYFRTVSPWALAEENAQAVRGNTRVRLVIGDRDGTLPVVREFSTHLENLRIPHTLTVLPGVGHDPVAVLEALGEANWEFYRTVLGAGGEDRDRGVGSAPEGD